MVLEVYYNEAFREKMAATGEREWKGMDIGLYQEICWGTSLGWQKELMGGKGVKRPTDAKRAKVCWEFNEKGWCSCS